MNQFNNIHNIRDLWNLAEGNPGEFAKYVGSRLRGETIEPLVSTYLDELPEYFLENAYKRDEEGSFKKRLGEIVTSLLCEKSNNHDPKDDVEREYISRLIHLAEVLDLNSAYEYIYRFARITEYRGMPGAHRWNIYTGFLGALAQIQPPQKISSFWYELFLDDEYIQYAHPLFTGLRRSSLKDAARTLPRLFDIALTYGAHFDSNRALRPLVKTLQLDEKAKQEFLQGFSEHKVNDLVFICDEITNLDEDVNKFLYYPLYEIYLKRLYRINLETTIIIIVQVVRELLVQREPPLFEIHPKRRYRINLETTIGYEMSKVA